MGQKLSVAELLKQGCSSEITHSLSQQMQSFERNLLENALSRHKGQVQPILDELKLPRRTFNELLKKHNLDRKSFL